MGSRGPCRLNPGPRAYVLTLAPVFGIGESTVMVVQGAICVQWFRGGQQARTDNTDQRMTELALAIGSAMGSVSALSVLQV